MTKSALLNLVSLLRMRGHAGTGTVCVPYSTRGGASEFQSYYRRITTKYIDLYVGRYPELVALAVVFFLTVVI